MPTPIRVTEIVPKEILVQPFTEQAFYDNFRRFVIIAAPICLGIAVSFGAMMAYIAIPLAGWVFGLIGASLALVLYSLYGAYHDARQELNNRSIRHNTVVLNVVSLIQTITINQQTINIKEGGVLNAGATVPSGTAMIDPSVESDHPFNDLYEMGMRVARVAIEGWNQNGGKRPRPKPFSADLMTEELHIGRERWAEVLQFVADARVIASPERGSWTPLCFSALEAERRFDAHLISLGLIKTSKGSQVRWIKQ